MLPEDKKLNATEIMVQKTQSDLNNGTVVTTNIPNITTTPPTPPFNQQESVFFQQDVITETTNPIRKVHSDCNGSTKPTQIPNNATTAPTPDAHSVAMKPVFNQHDKPTVTSETTLLDDLEKIIEDINKETENDVSVHQQLPDTNKTSEQDFVLIEITRKIAPVRSPLFSRVHLSNVDLDTTSGMRIHSLNSLKSQTLSSTHESRKGYFKYLDRQISVSTPDLYHPESSKDVWPSVDVLGRKGSALFYVNDDDEDKELGDNRKLSEILISRRCSMQSLRSNTSCRSGWTISSRRRVSMYSRLNFVKTDTADGAIEMTEVNYNDIMDTVSLGFEMNDHENTDNKHQLSRERQRMPKLMFSVLGSLLFPFFSMSIYIWDFGSDVRLALEYMENNELLPFGLTTLCIVVPVLLMTIVDLSWLWLDRPMRPYTKTFLVRFCLGMFSLGRIVRAIKHMEQIVKSKVLASEEKRRWHHDRAMDEKRDCYMLDFISTFTESVPQFIVQIYLLFEYNLPLTTIRVLNILSSWISIAWVYAAYYRCNRQAMTGRKDVNFVGFSFFFLSVLMCLAARVASITHFLITFNSWICAAVLFVHSFVAFLWIAFRIKPEMEGVVASRFGRCMYYLFFAYVYNVCFLHLNSSPGKYRMIIFYVFLYIENFVLAGLSLYKHSESEYEHAASLMALPFGLCLHVLFLMIFYKFFLTKALFR